MEDLVGWNKWLDLVDVSRWVRQISQRCLSLRCVCVCVCVEAQGFFSSYVTAERVFL